MMEPEANDTDKNTTLDSLRQMVKEFVDERDWQQFHSPKNLCMALSIEVSELMEHFQWISTDESREIHRNPEHQTDIQHELADVFCYILALANEMDIDLSSTLQEKMVFNRKKYPVDEYQGKF